MKISLFLDLNIENERSAHSANPMVNRQVFTHHMVNSNDDDFSSSTQNQFLFSLVLRNGNNEIECPVLMAYVCPKCGATGKSAHTIKYCPALSESERVALPTIKFFKEGRTSSGNQNLFKNDSSIRSNIF